MIYCFTFSQLIDTLQFTGASLLAHFQAESIILIKICDIRPKSEFLRPVVHALACFKPCSLVGSIGYSLLNSLFVENYNVFGM